MNQSDDPACILIVEDESMLRVVAVELLEDMGYRVLEAADGTEGHALLQSGESIDLLISDIKMPGMSGYELAEVGLALRPGLKVLLMTGYAHEPLPPAMKQAGVGMIHKPFDFDALTALATRMLNQG